MKNEGIEADMRILAEAERIRSDKERSEKPSDKDIRILAEAKRIIDDRERSDAARKRGRKADVFAGEGSFAGKLKARRQAMEEGDLEGAQQVFVK